MSDGILFYGDPHGNWRPLFRAAKEHKPAAVVLLGDMDLERPLRQQLHPLLDAGIAVRWIHGNHDTDSIEWHDRLWEDYPSGSLHCRWAQLDGMIVAGLGGVYKAKVWYPKEGNEKPLCKTRTELIRTVLKNDRLRGGLPLSHRDTILPEDHIALRGLRPSVLVCHEAPTSHRHGFGAIDDLARNMGVRLVVHGHHHDSYNGQTRDGIQVRGLGKAEPWLVTKEMLIA